MGAKKPFCFPLILLPKGVGSRQNPHVQPQGPLLLAKVSFVRFDSADWTISGYDHTVSSSVFQTSPIIIVV